MRKLKKYFLILVLFSLGLGLPYPLLAQSYSITEEEMTTLENNLKTLTENCNRQQEDLKTLKQQLETSQLDLSEARESLQKASLSLEESEKEQKKKILKTSFIVGGITVGVSAFVFIPIGFFAGIKL